MCACCQYSAKLGHLKDSDATMNFVESVLSRSNLYPKGQPNRLLDLEENLQDNT